MTRLLQIVLVSALLTWAGASSAPSRRLPFCIPRGGASDYSGILDGVKSQVLAAATESVSLLVGGAVVAGLFICILETVRATSYLTVVLFHISSG